MSDNSTIIGMQERFEELIAGQEPRNFMEKMFAKGFFDAVAGVPLSQSYLEIGDTEDLAELERKLFLLGFSTGNALALMRPDDGGTND